MNYFITTNSEEVVIRVKKGEYSDNIICSFTAANALAAIVACEALNSNCLSQTKATQELEVELPPYTCKNCSTAVEEGQKYCSWECDDAGNHGCMEVAPSTHSCTHCDNQVHEGSGLCHQCYMAMQPM